MVVVVDHSKCLDCIFRYIWLFLTGETNGSSVDDEVETSVEDGVRLHPDPNHCIGPHLRGLLLDLDEQLLPHIGCQLADDKKALVFLGECSNRSQTGVSLNLTHPFAF